MSIAEELGRLVNAFISTKSNIQYANFAAQEPWRSEPTGDDVGYLLRTCNEYGHGSGDALQDHYEADATNQFNYPERGYVLAGPGGANWGIHGFLNGIGDWTRLGRYKNATWLIIAVLKSECRKIAIGGSYRAPRGWVVYSGDAVGAMAIMIPWMSRNGALTDLAKLMCDDYVDDHETVAVRGGASNVMSEDMNAVSFGGGGQSFTFGANRYAVSFRSDSHSWGNFGCAVSLRGGWADGRGIYSDAISRRSDMVQTGQVPPLASAGMCGVAVAIGKDGMARASIGGAIVLTETIIGGASPPSLERIVAVRIGDTMDGILVMPGVWYNLENGKLRKTTGPQLPPSSLHGYTPDV